MRFRPVADGYVISNDLYSLYMADNFNDTPVLLGHTSDEMGSFGGNQNITKADFTKQIKEQYGSHAELILSAYPHATDADATKASRDIRNDSSFSWNTWTWSRLQSQKGKYRAYQYYFDYHPGILDAGSGHGSDVPYAFQTLDNPAEPPKEEDLRLSDMISTFWVNFAKTGDPNGQGLPEWPAFSENDQKVMIFDAAPGARPLPALERLKVIDSYFSALREKSE